MSKTNAHYTEHTLEDANAMPDPEYIGIDYGQCDETAYATYSQDKGFEPISKEQFDEYSNSELETPDLEQYRKDTEKMHWLDQKWQEIWEKVKKLTGYDSPPF